MDSDKRQWRFYTRLDVGDNHVSEHWCWERLGADREVVEGGSGFTTFPAAVRDARRHGFAGDPKTWDRMLSPRRAEDLSGDEAHELQRWLLQELPLIEQAGGSASAASS